MLKVNQTRGGSKVPILGDLPLVGVLFRGVSNTDIQSKLYIFVRAQIIRPAESQTAVMEDLQRISEENRRAFERSEGEFQGHQDVPAVRPQPTDPAKVLEAQ
jgi:general secretion pathway protein D